MDTSLIFERTAKGQAAFASGTGELSQAQRLVLVMVDGQRPAGEIARAMSAIGNGYGLLAQLVDLGYIEIKKISPQASGRQRCAALAQHAPSSV